MKKSFLSVVIALVMVVTSVVPFGTFAVTADEVSAEPQSTLIKNGAIKIADFSNLTQDTLMQNIGKVSEGHTLSVNTDSAYTLNGAATSLKWEMPAGKGSNSYFEIVSDYDFSEFAGYDYTVYVKYYAKTPSDLATKTFKFNKQIGAINEAGSLKYVDLQGMTFNSSSTNMWRADYGLHLSGKVSDTVSYSTSVAALGSISPAEDSKIYVRLGANGGTSEDAVVYLDGIWLVLTNYNKSTLASPVPGFENGANIDASVAAKAYSFEFASEIAALSDAVSVTKDGEDITSATVSSANGSTLSVAFSDNMTPGEYNLTINKSKVRALTGETMSADASFGFTVFDTKQKKIEEIENALYTSGMFKIADFSDLTPETLMNNIATVEGNNTVEIDDYYVFEKGGAKTSLKWTQESAATGIVIKSDYDLSYFPDNYTVFVKFFAPTPATPIVDRGFRFTRAIGTEPAYNKSKFTSLSGFGFSSSNLDIWREDLSIATHTDIAKLNPAEDSDLYVYLRNDSHSNPKDAYPVYIDSVWIGLPDYGQNLKMVSTPANSGVWALKNPADAANYVLTFDKEIRMIDESKITVTKDGNDITSECDIYTSYYSLYINFASGLDTDAQYKVKVDKSAIKGNLGAALKSNYEDNFIVETPNVEVNNGKIILADFGNGSISSAEAYNTDFKFELNEDAAFVSEGKTSSLKITLPATDTEKALYINPQVRPENWPKGSKIKFRFYNAGAPATETSEAVEGVSKLNLVAHKVGGEANWKPYWNGEITLPYGEWVEFSYNADTIIKTTSLNGSALKFRINHGGWNIDSTGFVPNANIYLDSVWLEMPSVGSELSAPTPSASINTPLEVIDFNATNTFSLTFDKDIYTVDSGVKVYEVTAAGDALVDDCNVTHIGKDLVAKFNSINEGTYKVALDSGSVVAEDSATLNEAVEYTFKAVNAWSDGKLMLADFGHGDAFNYDGGTWTGAALSGDVVADASTSALKATFADANKYMLITLNHQRNVWPDDSKVVIKIYNDGEAANTVLPVFCTVNGESGWKPYKLNVSVLEPGWNEITIKKSDIPKGTVGGAITDSTELYLRLNYGGWDYASKFTAGDSVYVDSIWVESDSMVFDTMVADENGLSAQVLISAGNKAKFENAAIVAAVYDNATTLAYAKIAGVENSEINVSIDELAEGQTVKYIFLENMLCVKPSGKSISFPVVAE